MPTPENLLTESNKLIKVNVLNYEFYWKLYLYHQKTGFCAKALGMAYMANDFICDDMVSLIALLCDLTACSTTTPSIDKDTWGGVSKFIDPSILSNYINPNNNNVHCCIENESKLESDQDVHQLYKAHYQHIVDKLDIKQSDNVLIIESGSIELLNIIGETGCRLDVLTKKPHQFRSLKQHIQNQQNINIKFINQDESYYGQEKSYDKIICIEIDERENDQDLFEFCQTNLQLNGLAYIQAITGPFHPYHERDYKPQLQPTYWQSYYLKKSNIESKYWGMIAKFTHNPFQLESRYLSVVDAIGSPKGFINGHIASSNNNNNRNIPNLSNDIVKLLSNQNQLQLLEMNNIGDSYPSILEYNLIKLGSMKSRLVKDLQEEAMKNGCDLKMNEADLLEIYRTIQFHYYYLIASFKTVWSVTKVLLTKK
ncbi:hypothetical protein PPL_10690 [Heterostelium album PN500]|uniref:Uncharacterized protein n=1 Tax=Heterostelium pallidum (strain ATCC 26659 / Pp 5 / PN500) TaxID=670386 RepID=D3BRS9_HETP5|nr:hypothetical protein PPL_10690 [Heterostelium album PN500]EFA76111.1 hypothetical protein PPL_10690 [Heterostelium album PN500]|eukprot:XP_020428245.1 hypothetical protein PPL_10690 [Heterostelium album PN500]